MEERALLAFILSFVVLLGWLLFFAPKQNIYKQKGNIIKKSASEKRIKKELKIPPPASLPTYRANEVETLVDSPLYRAKISNLGPSIKEFLLKRYYKTPDKNSGWVDIIPPELKSLNPIILGFDLLDSTPIPYKPEKVGIKVDKQEKELTYTASYMGISVKKTFHFYPNSYKIDLTIDIRNLNKSPIKGAFIAKLNGLIPNHRKTHYYSHLGLASYVQNELKQIKLKKKGQKKIFSGNIGWIACESRYFMAAIIPQLKDGTLEVKRFQNGILEGYYKSSSFTIPPAGDVKHKFILYIGPKEIPILKKIGFHLDEIVDFGWTDFIAKPLLYVLRFFYRFTHNYGIAIILLTILVKIIFWPFTHKSYESMKQMQKLQPLMERIREKYKDDKERLNREIMNLYRTYKVNPLSGCLPILIQIPVFFALYRVLCDAIELRHAPFMLWINDLSAPDRLFRFSFHIPLMAPPYGIPVLTLLMGLTMYIQQKMSPQPGDPSQAKMMMLLPIVFTVMFINFPSGLVLYWLVNNILSIIQQYIVQKRTT